MAGKPFSEKLYDEDDNAKYQVIEWLTEQGYHAYVNPDQYGIDVIAEQGDVTYFYEVEVKHNWKGPVFIYDGIHWTERKRKFAVENAFFVMLNHERTHAFITTWDVVLAAPVIVKNTKYTANEKFIEVSKKDCVLIEF